MERILAFSEPTTNPIKTKARLNVLVEVAPRKYT